MSSGIRSVRAAPLSAPASQAWQRMQLPRVVSLFALAALVATALLPTGTQAATRAWTLAGSPTNVSGSTGSVTLTATNTGDDGGGEAIGCVVVTIPRSGFTVSAVTQPVTSDGDPWTSTWIVGATDTTVTLYSNSGGGNRLHGVPQESAQVTVSFSTTGSDGTFGWVGNAYNKEDCTDDFFQPRTVTVSVNTGGSSGPTATADSYRVARNATLSVPAPGVLGNDVDSGGDSMSAVLASGPTSGSLTLNSNGSFSYTPNVGFIGTDSFSYRASADGDLSAPATVTISVSAEPTAVADPSFATTRDTALTVAAPGVLGNDADPESDPLTAALASAAASGSVVLNPDGSFTYTPNAGFVGTDSFTYTASDGAGTSAPATVTISVLLPNLPPVALADAYSVAEDAVLTVGSATGVLANDSDPNGDPLDASVDAPPANGILTLAADGSFVYTPDADFAGIDTFTYTVSDGVLASTVTLVTLTVTPMNDVPAAAPDAYVTTEDTALDVSLPGVLANDTDADGDPLTAQLVSGPSAGTLTLHATGGLRYVPPADFHGPVIFTYRARDPLAASAPATVTVMVDPVNDAPVATADTASTAHGTAVEIDVLANDADVDGDPLAVGSIEAPTSGTAEIVAGRVRYRPAPGYAGSVSFTYAVTDGALADTATITVEVTAPARTPGPPEPASPVPSPSPQPSTDPTSDPSPTPEAAVSPSATPEPSGEETGEPIIGPRIDPPLAPVIVITELQPLAEAQLTMTALGAGDGGAFGDLGTLFGGFTGSGFAWAVPAAMLGLPGLLFMSVVAVQVLGAAAWVPAIRRHLGGTGAARRRRADRSS